MSLLRDWRKVINRLSMMGLFLAVATVATVAVSAAVHGQDTAAAVEPDPRSVTAQEVLRGVTDRVLVVIDEARDYVDEDPERYYAAVHEVLDPVVDFRGFARGVMGQYATGDRYRSLDEAGREKLRGQLDRFSETMRRGLVRTYSKGLLAFGGSRVELDDSSGGDVSSERATLRQLIYSDEAQPYVVIYNMARDKDGHWQMRNLVVENVNLGQIYRSQFESAARRFDGDLDKVIDTWSADTEQGP